MPHEFHPGFCCGDGEPRSLPADVHSAVVWSFWSRWDELYAQKSYVPNEKTREALKKASKYLAEAGILRFDPLKDK